MGNIFSGNTAISKIYRGQTEIQKVYKGNVEVWAAGGGGGGVTADLQYYIDGLDPSSYPGSGTTVYDLSGNSNTTTIVGSPTYDATYGAWDIAGVNTKYLTATHSSTLNMDYQAGCSFGVWFTKDSTSGYRMLLTKNPSDGKATNEPGNFEIRNGPGVTSFDNGAQYCTGAGGYNFTTLNGTFDTTNWWFMVYTIQHNGSNSWTTKLYLNNTLTDTNSETFDAGWGCQNTEPLLIGRRADGSNSWNGKVAYVKMWGKVLDATEVDTEWNFQKARFGY